MCDNLLLMQIIYITKIILKIICYGIPPIVIIVSIIDLSNVVISGKEDEFKDKMKTTIKRVLAGLIVFILLCVFGVGILVATAIVIIVLVKRGMYL